MGRRKSHHTHEINDAFAQGWDARFAWRPNQPKPINPYALADETRLRKQSDARREVSCFDREQWQLGWDECDEDRRRNDLEIVTPDDFRKVVSPGMEVEIVNDDSENDELDEDFDDEE